MKLLKLFGRLTLLASAVAALLGLVGVILGAISSHALDMSERQARAFEIAVQYQIFHVFAILLAAYAAERYQSRLFGWSIWAFFAGIGLFCFSIYVWVIGDVAWATKITPVGGFSLMAAWLMLAAGFFEVWRRK